MNFKLSTLAAAAALLVNCSAPVMADSWTPFGTIGHWHLTASDKSCRARAEYQNGTYLSFALNGFGAAMISIENPGWHIPEGSYEVVTQVDRTAPEKVKATAQGDFLLFQFYFNEPTMNLLSYGRTLSVTVGTQSYQYNLVQSEAVLKALVKCVAPRLEAANPFAGQQSAAPPPAANPFAETTSNPYRRM